MWIIRQYRCFKTIISRVFVIKKGFSKFIFTDAPTQCSYDILFLNLPIDDIITEPRSPVIGSAASYSGGPEFKVRPTRGAL
jgi:hypothetical protein